MTEPGRWGDLGGLPATVSISGSMPEILMEAIAVSRSDLTIMPIFRRRVFLPRMLATVRDQTEMSKQALYQPGRLGRRLGKRNRARLRSLVRRANAWKTRVRRAAALSLAAAAMWGGQTAYAQLGSVSTLGQAGQMGMAPAGGIVNRAVAGFQALDENGPGWLYYGVNAADRGLGYNGSYFTLGGFIPYAEDDLGGLWSADLRSHLSTYGGFFSNVGVVRKQFMGGTIGGLGVYWDYDADLNQNPTGGACGTEPFGQFGHVYNQVGVSAEWLTDFGNLRSNGYIPVGTTAYTAGNPGSTFYQNYVMCNYGLDAALAGADLEVGAYVPGLADWAGMISVGGYTFGQARYNWSAGSKAGQDVVPYFGGVYTRLDMTLMRNWDFSLQANNDSYFDWTGFARLTYRMGGSRRRNVPDQMEQPMMRNEHIVRAHQTPVVAVNEATGTPWRVIVVNNAATGAGTGTAESPFRTIAAANAAATNPYDIVFVEKGNATYAQATPFSPLASNQYFIGDGANFYLASCCGPINLNSGAGVPTISNPSGPSVILDGGLTTANFNVVGSRVGVQAGPGLLVGDTATVSNYQILGTGTSGITGTPYTGIELLNTGGNVVVTNTLVKNMTDTGIRVNGVDAGSGNAPNLSFQGSVTNDATTGGGTSPIIEVKNTLGGGGGNILIAAGPTPAGATVPNLVSDNGGGGVVVENSDSNVQIDNMTLTNSIGTAVTVAGSGGAVAIGTNGPATITNPADGAILVQNGSTDFIYKGSITNSAGNAVKVDGTTGGSVLVTNPSGQSTDTGLGLVVQNSSGNVTIEKFDVASSQQGLLVQNNTFVPGPGGTSGQFNNINVTKASGAGVQLAGNTGPVGLNNVNISLSSTNSNTAVGFLGTDNDTITMTGNNTVAVDGNAAISVTNAPTVSDVTNLLFTTVSSSNSPTNGVLLNGVDGTFDVTGSGITVANSTGAGVLIQDTQTGLAVNVPGTVTVTGAAGGGISLLDVNAPGIETVLFNTVSLQTTGGTGLLVQNSTAPAVGNGLVQINGGTIASTNGAAISAINANLDVNLTSVSSTGAGGNGISLVASDNSSNAFPAVRIGTTTISTPTANGIYLFGNQPMQAGAGVFADFGQVSITSAGQSGIFAEATNASFNGAMISSSGVNGVTLVAAGGENTTFLITNSKINGAGGSGVNMLSSGGGVLNATVLTNQITATGNSLLAVNADSGSTIGLNMSGNAGVSGGAPGAGNILLNNAAAGTFDVTQSQSAGPPPVSLSQAISASNNSPITDITTIVGTLGEGATIPIP
jgi:hypothetical protein